MNSAPKYSKIELIISNDSMSAGKITPEDLITFNDCGMFMTGDHLIIVEDSRDESGQNNQATEGTVFPLNNIKKYKTYKN